MKIDDKLLLRQKTAIGKHSTIQWNLLHYFPPNQRSRFISKKNMIAKTPHEMIRGFNVVFTFIRLICKGTHTNRSWKIDPHNVSPAKISRQSSCPAHTAIKSSLDVHRSLRTVTSLHRSTNDNGVCENICTRAACHREHIRGLR